MSKNQPHRKLQSTVIHPSDAISGSSVPSEVWTRSSQFGASTTSAYILMLAARKVLEEYGRNHLDLLDETIADTKTPIFDFPLFTLRHDPHRLIASHEEAKAYLVAKTREHNKEDGDT